MVTEKESAGLAERLIADSDKGELATGMLPPGKAALDQKTVAKLLADFVIALHQRQHAPGACKALTQ